MPLDPFTGHTVSAATFARVTSRIAPTLAAHPSWSPTEARRFLRGHGVPGQGVTPEHGGVVSRVRAQIASGPVRNAGTLVEPTYRDSRVISRVNTLAKKGTDARVAVNVHTKSGGWQQVGKNLSRRTNGFSAKYVANLIADHNGDLRAAMADLIARGMDSIVSNFEADGYVSATAYTDAIDGWQVVVYE